ncbi:uncharacterized protein BX663DRAFT_494871 [Cokeromyces recurvatus]|uniref:uncharacterized protein n=1 Tax=Cokeromyces recurvatus TaxID=90255 RepID=UPI0022205F5F|nr:uncharacterized protein BX663DRAFT_494871 [Cokeromyces recurvatus]KAI7907113.1 hypothetical protein BX663DRAFT_494871 [Cokeromyces recurvatus]
MSSLASLISNVKANTANNDHINRSLKRKATFSKEELRQQKRKALLKKKADDKKESNEPSIVVFDDSALQKKPVYEDKASKKQFMNSKITTPDPYNITTPKNKPSAKELEEEAENQKHDLELHQLLNTSNLLEELAQEEMTAREKRKNTMKKLVDLGAKPAANQKMPLSLKLSLDKSRKERELAKLQEAKDLGIYDKSLKHLYIKTKPKKRNRDPGITNGIGRMKGATLTIKQSDIERIQKQGSKKSSGKKRR